MSMDATVSSFLTDPASDPAEVAWLAEVSPTAVRDNAHRMYEFMAETGQPAESFIRELAFSKASEALGLPYDAFYEAWLGETPIGATS